jgi:hypothetical protein
MLNNKNTIYIKIETKYERSPKMEKLIFIHKLKIKIESRVNKNKTKTKKKKRAIASRFNY